MWKFDVFNILDSSFYDGKVSTEFDAFSQEGYWFFQPQDWFAHPEKRFYGTNSHTRCQTLMAYSCGFPTPEAAMEAAQIWAQHQSYSGVNAEIILHPYSEE